MAHNLAEKRAEKSVDITPIQQFLYCETPTAWLEYAVTELETLLIDHAHCEKKAAATAVKLMFSYPERIELLKKLSQLIREEVLHFEQVLEFIEQQGIKYRGIKPSRYAAGLHQFASKDDPQRLIDSLIIGGIIEARSCERFHALVPYLKDSHPELAKYYRFLLKSESRHFMDYIDLAKQYSKHPIDERLDFFLQKEKELIETPDPLFRFHSGVPQSNNSLN
ncbi:tRNA-(ms[2]io[6]A)-hydroxylase [Kangiella spongicola]|uniref:tRNA-(Ms[2]io[6]A)-hydroxylase n=1 Tax=Kangiella spongicola TaxID=796379 RepID=A0A318D7H6_9GAMM|nr:tRNA-(ms[2]io[6]A)-hydroxylase [Kangiella spongicola]PXF63748.1 tRNA-(ms[2]io[6]A)-hydroxylase [Kangiella spongicola]